MASLFSISLEAAIVRMRWESFSTAGGVVDWSFVSSPQGSFKHHRNNDCSACCAAFLPCGFWWWEMRFFVASLKKRPRASARFRRCLARSASGRARTPHGANRASPKRPNSALSIGTAGFNCRSVVRCVPLLVGAARGARVARRFDHHLVELFEREHAEQFLDERRVVDVVEEEPA